MGTINIIQVAIAFLAGGAGGVFFAFLTLMKFSKTLSKAESFFLRLFIVIWFMVLGFVLGML